MTKGDSLMNKDFYLERRLEIGATRLDENELLESHQHMIILAEPGAGKSSLMKSLASKLNTNVITAITFKWKTRLEPNPCLIIDAIDELAKQGPGGFEEILVKAAELNPTYVIFSSRSSEWTSASMAAFEFHFASPTPCEARLCELHECEQKRIFENDQPNENFFDFKKEVSRFDLSALLTNPQFLKLFAAAYVESKGHFKNKHSIFNTAIEHLAKEANENLHPSPDSLSTEKKIKIAEEVFCKLLLANAEGVSRTDCSSNHSYPMLASLNLETFNETWTQILATRLFKPADIPDFHSPVHKIVAEYGAAKYLIRKINVNNGTSALTLSKYLPIIAPNSVVREELRGLLGWMATLGNRQIQEKAIRLDPYAVLANGDPSLLENSSKKLLIESLIKAEEIDPFFRGKDWKRNFSLAGFFNQDLIELIRPILKKRRNSELRNLILELLESSTACGSSESRAG